MKKICLSGILICSFFASVNAQTSASKDTLTNSEFISDSVCLKPEIQAMYPGGDAAFKRYLSKHFIYSNEDVKGSVVVKFIVDKNFNPTNIEAISGPEQLKADAIKMIQKSGHWIAAVCNGKKAASYKTVTIVFPNESSY